jgi:predicted amidohydrolase
MPDVKLALVQMNCPKGRIADNLAAIDRCIDEAAAEDTDVIVFPEMSLTGYIDPIAQPESILTVESEPVTRFCAMTERTPVMALAGIVERNQSGKPFITQLVAADGKLLGIYRKGNVADDELPRFEPATETPLFTHRGVRFGVALCADVGHAGLFAAYAEQGAKLVLVGAAPGLYGPQETRDWQAGFDWWHEECARNLSVSAAAGAMHIAVATQAGSTADEDFPGGGYVFAPTGERVAESPDWNPGTLYAEVDI